MVKKEVNVRTIIEAELTSNELVVLQWLLDKHLGLAAKRFQEALDIGFVDMMADHLSASLEDCQGCDAREHCPFSKAAAEEKEEDEPITIEAGLVIDGAKA